MIIVLFLVHHSASTCLETGSIRVYFIALFACQLALLLLLVLTVLASARGAIMETRARRCVAPLLYATLLIYALLLALHVWIGTWLFNSLFRSESPAAASPTPIASFLVHNVSLHTTPAPAHTTFTPAPARSNWSSSSSALYASSTATPVTPCSSDVVWVVRFGFFLFWAAFGFSLLLLLLVFDPLGNKRLRGGDLGELARTRWKRRMDLVLYLFGQTERLKHLSKVAEYFADLIEVRYLSIFLCLSFLNNVS